MLTIFRRLKGAPETASALRDALAEAEAALPAAVTALADAEAARAALLLTGSDAEIIAAEAKITTARIAVDRLHAARGELSRRANEAESAELTSHLDAQRNAIEKRAAAFGKALPARYDALAAPLVALMDELIAIDAEIARVNEADQEAARDGKIGPRVRVAEVETRANTYRHSAAFHAGSWLALTSILASEKQPGFGNGRHVMALSGRLLPAQAAE